MVQGGVAMAGAAKISRRRTAEDRLSVLTVVAVQTNWVLARCPDLLREKLVSEQSSKPRDADQVLQGLNLVDRTNLGLVRGEAWV